LFVGVTTFNDEQWIGICLSALRRTLQGVSYQLVVLDNCSADKTLEIARQSGAETLSYSCEQGEALNILLHHSRAKYTLLLHSDVVMLHPGWFALVKQQISKRVILVSPNDNGLGNYLRTYGAGKPESSFMFFATRPAQALAGWDKSLLKYRLKKFRRKPFLYPLRHFDFYGPHVTHRIPQLLEGRGRGWFTMDVFPSRKLSEPWFTYNQPGANWYPEWGAYDYGFGNFYGIGGVITHYHNWYSRQMQSTLTGLNRNGVPYTYIHGYSRRFLDDYQYDRVNLPDVSTSAVHAG
jgi:glycosyltransferase involved in cell wall biosynthesis